MTTQISPLPIQRFYDNNNNPLAGGRLYTYIAGTTTAFPTYADSTGATPNTNPVVMNARGEANVWMTAGQAYKLVLKDASDVTIWTEDQILSGVTSDFLANLASTTNLNQGVSLVGGSARTVTTISALRALPRTASPEALVTGYYAQGDGGGGTYYYDATDVVSADNGGTVIVATDGGRWKLAATNSYSVKQFGAKGDGIADDTAAIQASINALSSGGEVVFPQSTYKVSSTILIGNGSSAVASTIWGITLRGLGHPSLPSAMFTGYPATGGAKLLWAGTGSPMFSIRGPLNGWGISNMYLDGASLATRGIEVISASFGNSANIALTNFVDTSIYSTTLQTYVGFGLANSMHNFWSGLAINVPAVAGAKGIVLTGTPTATPTPSNACYDTFNNVIIYLPTTLTTYGFYLQWTDSNVIQNLHVFGGSVTAVCVQLDYTILANMPSGNSFIGLDPSGTGSNIQFGQSGVPNSGARPNRIVALSEINNGAQPNFPNLIPDLPTVQTKVSQVGQTAAISTTTLFTPFIAGLYRVSYYMVLTTGGTAGTIQLYINYNDGFTVKAASSIAINANGSAPSMASGVFVMQAVAGVAISYNVNFTGVTGSAVYSVYANIERIG